MYIPCYEGIIGNWLCNQSLASVLLRMRLTEHRQNILWHKSCFLRSLSQFNRKKNKNKQMEHYQTYKLLNSKGNQKKQKQKQKITYRRGENICKWYDRQGIDLQNRLSVQFSSAAQLCPTLCGPTDCNTPGLPVHHQLPEFTQTHVHWVGDTIQPPHPLLSPSPPAFNLSQHQGVSSSDQVADVLELQH